MSVSGSWVSVGMGWGLWVVAGNPSCAHFLRRSLLGCGLGWPASPPTPSHWLAFIECLEVWEWRAGVLTSRCVNQQAVEASALCSRTG